MSFQTLFYRIIYQSQINYCIRNINVAFKRLLPDSIKIPPSGTMKCKTDSGIIKISTNPTSYLTQVLFWKGYKGFEYSEIFEKLSKKISSFIDIGANIGFYSLLATKSNINIKVYAIEPANGAFAYLMKNIFLNNFENAINAHKLAISSKKGEIEFFEVQSNKYPYLKHTLSGENNIGTKTTSRNFISYKTDSVTLSYFIKQQNITTIDLIKIDTEGTEEDILSSGFEQIKKFTPIVICETLFNTTEYKLENFFKKLDYSFYNHKVSKNINGLVKVNTIQRTKDDGIRNCFFVPKNKEHYISEFVIDKI